MTTNLDAQALSVDDFNPGPNDFVQSMIVLPDERIIIIGNSISEIGGQHHGGIARLNPDGSLDPSFDPILKEGDRSGFGECMAVQSDGKILLGGQFDAVNGQMRTNLIRLNAEDTLDSAFYPNVGSPAERPDEISSLAVQADGKILAGEFCVLCPGALVRLNADGTADAGFRPVPLSFGPYATAIQDDGKILIVGAFNRAAGGPRNYIVRLSTDGTVDPDFNPEADGVVGRIAIQPDGKILVAGFFSELAGQVRTNIARLNSDGSLDTSFNASVDSWVQSMALQTDGRIVLGGSFTFVNDRRRIGLARLNPNGSLDSTFATEVGGFDGANVSSVALQADGKILVGGSFTNLGGKPRNYIGRLGNTGPAAQHLSYLGSTVTWQRGGTGPEVWRTLFEASSDGQTWRNLGAGRRVAGGWQLTNVSVVPGATIRARGFVAASGKSEGMVVSTLRTPELPAFTRITSSPVAKDGADGEGAAWVDFDGDGDLDLYVSCNSTGANLLYRNDGSGVFTRITSGPIVTDGGRSIAAAWADLDNDGRIDLFVSKQSGRGLVFRQQTDGTFTKTALSKGGFSWGAGWGDYDNDGFVDLLVADTSAKLLWHNDGDGGLTPVTTTPIITANASSIAWADFDNDGDADVFVANGSANSRLYQNEGNGVFTAITNGPLAVQSSGGTGAAWGDYDNDGFLDLFLGRLDFSQALPSFLYHNNGDGTFTKVDQPLFNERIGQVTGGSWGDFDNDGWLDLFVSEFGADKNRLYHNNCDGTFTRIMTGSVANDNGSSTAGIWGDYDRDGFLDLFVANGNGGGEINDFLYHNNGNSNGWITIKCVGTRSNRSAIGTKVRIKATIDGQTFWQLREVNTGDGWADNPLEVHFGLGSSTNVDVLRIEWPSGTVQEFANVAARQYLTVTEPAVLVASLPNGNPRLLLHGGRNMRYGIEISTDLINWKENTLVDISSPDGTAVVPQPDAVTETQLYLRARLQ